MSTYFQTPITSFEKFAKTYDKTTPIQSNVADYVAKRIQACFVPSEFSYNTPMCIVDVGCGTGKLSHALLLEMMKANQLPLNIQLTGVDISSTMLEIWQKRMDCLLEQFQSQHQLNHQIICTDMSAIPLADYSAEIVMSSFALHWTSPKVLSELIRLVKAKGELHLAIPVLGSFSQVSKRFPKLPIFDFLPSSSWLAQIQPLVEARQGSVLYQVENSFTYRYDNLQSLLKDLKQMGGAISGKTSIDTATLRQYLQDTSPVSLDYSLLTIGVQL